MEVAGGDGGGGLCLEEWPGALSPSSLPPPTLPCACLDLRLASSAGGQPVDQSRWAPPPILPTLTGASSFPGEI